MYPFSMGVGQTVSDLQFSHFVDPPPFSCDQPRGKSTLGMGIQYSRTNILGDMSKYMNNSVSGVSHAYGDARDTDMLARAGQCLWHELA